MGLFSLSDLEYMFWNGIRNGSIGTVGAKGDPGGIVMGTLLTSADDLDTKTTTGIYRWNGSMPVNSPAAGILYAIMYIDATDTNRVIQRVHRSDGPVIHQRAWAGGVWGSWKPFNSTRVDQTAGRAIYQWDDLNSREQLVYGDTGWRNISANLINGWTTTSSLQIRRVGRNVILAGLVTGTAMTSDHFVPIITGFAPLANQPQGIAIASDNTSRIVSNNATNIFIASGAATTYNIHSSFMTNDAWPTALPGTANGTIPNL